MRYKPLKTLFLVLAIPLVGVVFTAFNCAANFNEASKDPSIIGTWKSEEDSTFVLKFTTTQCIRSSEGIPLDTFGYSVSNTSPQCGVVVPVNSHTEYLRLQNLTDTSCYEIYGLTSQFLSLSMLGTGKPAIFKKQP